MAKDKKAEGDTAVTTGSTTGSTSATTVSTSATTVFQDVANYEENMAKAGSAAEDANLFFETCEKIRKLFAEIAALKNSGDTSAKRDIGKKRIRAALLIVELKKLNRLEKIRTKIGRDALHAEKKRLDSTHLSLQNLLYETDYLDKEVAKCLQFESKDEEIDLVSVEEFYEKAPPETSMKEITEKDEHRLRLARLEWELKQRKDLAESCLELRETGRRVSAALNETRDRLESLAPQLKDLLTAAEPLRRSLGASSSGPSRSSDAKVDLLPLPLFLLYARTSAYAEAFGDDSVAVCVIGDEEEAVRMEESETAEICDSDSDDEPKEDENRGKSKRHRRATAKISERERAEQKTKTATRAHPLNVRVTVKMSQVSIVINFYYLVRLKMIAVKSCTALAKNVGVCSSDVLNGHNILGGLYENDHGEDSPHPATDYILRMAKVAVPFSSFIPQLGHTYRWAQRMCGLDFLSLSDKNETDAYDGLSKMGRPSPELSTASVESVLLALKKRMKARLSLMKELQNLESGNIAPFENMSDVPFSLNSSLTVWQSISWTEYGQAASVKKLLDSRLVSQHDLLYRTIITRQSAKLMALVAVKRDYPKRAPIFSLTLHWNGTHHAGTDDNIRDIERCINTDWCATKNPTSEKTVSLSGQLTKLICYMDILLESMGSSEFPADKVMFQSSRGRNRIKPYKFIKDCSGIFTQY